METSLAFPKRLVAAVVALFTLLVCLSLSAQAQQKMPPPNRSVAPLAAVGPDCTTVVANLIVNCGFETGDTTGWSTFGGGISANNTNPNHGVWAAQMGEVFNTACIGQSFVTTVGQTYTLSFALKSSGRPNNFYVIYSGTTVSGDMQNMPDFDYTQYVIGGLVGAGDDSVYFCARNDPAFFFLDDVIFN